MIDDICDALATLLACLATALRWPGLFMKDLFA